MKLGISNQHENYVVFVGHMLAAWPIWLWHTTSVLQVHNLCCLPDDTVVRKEAERRVEKKLLQKESDTPPSSAS